MCNLILQPASLMSKIHVCLVFGMPLASVAQQVLTSATLDRIAGVNYEGVAMPVTFGEFLSQHLLKVTFQFCMLH